MGTASSAGTLAFGDLVAHFERLFSSRTDAEQRTIERLYASTHSRRSAEQPALREIGGKAEQHNSGCNCHPAEAGISYLWQLLFPGERHDTGSGFGLCAAGNAIVQVGFNQQSAGSAELTRTILGKELKDISAAPDGIDLPRRCGDLLAHALPHALTGGAHGFAIGLLRTHGCQRLFEPSFGFLWFHRVCLPRPLKSFLRRERVRCRTTATTAGEVFIIAAISRFVRSSIKRSTNISAQRGFNRARAWRSQSRSSAECGP